MNRACDPWPPPKETAERGKLGGREKTDSARSGKTKISALRHPAQPSTPYAVWIRFFGQAQPWHSFATATSAATEIAKLRKDGFQAELVLL
jgi:hypothetical protein